MMLINLLIIKKQNNKRNHAIFGLILLVFIILTCIYLLRLKDQYVEILDAVTINEVKAQNFQSQPSNAPIPIAAHLHQAIDFTGLDQLMAVRTPDIQFNHLRLNKVNLLQVEGTASQPGDVSSIRNDAKNIGLMLEIKQIKTDDSGLIQFELNRVKS